MSQRPKRVALALGPKLQHALIENDLFTIVNRKPSGFPNIPSRTEHDPSPRTFVPAQDPFKTEWLTPLDYTEETIPVVTHITPGGHRMFILDSEVIQLWEALERALRKLLRASMRLANVGLPSDFRFWSYPRQYGYSRPHYSQHAARCHAAASRDAFLPLAGAISYFVHRMKILEEIRDTQSGRGVSRGLTKQDLEEQHWRQVLELLQKETGLSSIWLSYWRKSLLEAPLAGAFVDTQRFKLLVPVLIKAKVPVALYWGDARETWNIASSLSAWAPHFDVLNRLVLIRYGSARQPVCGEISDLNSEVERAQSGKHAITVIEDKIYEILIQRLDCELPSTQRVDRGSPSHSRLAVATAPPARKILVLPNSGQRPDEDMVGFFRRRAEEKASCIARESEVDHQRRLQRESVAAKDLPPGRKGATVFYWELVDGVRRRMLAGRNNYESYWEEYGPHQRKYNSVRNEWDVCTEFDPDDTPSYWSDDEEVAEPGFEVLPDAEDDLDLQGGGSTSAEYLRHLHGDHIPTSTHPPLEFSDPFEDIAYHRLGFLDYIDVIMDPAKDVHWNKVRNVLGNARSEQAPQLKKSTCDLLRGFIAALLDGNRLSDAPKNLDLNVEEAEIHGNWGFSVIYKDVMDGYYFIVPGLGNQYPFQLALKSAGAVLEVARRGWGPEPANIIPNLMRQGIAFNTFIRDTPRIHPLDIPRPRPLLGYRDQYFLRKGPDAAVREQVLEEYRAYEYQQDRFLRTERGRAAILAGGIVARLAQHIVKEDVVLKGPTEKIWSSGECIWDGYTESLGYWDDQLTEGEIDLICGVYDVGTGERDHWGYMQVAQKSWWPKPSAWKVSGLSCGYWSRDAEAWFQRRLEGISSGSAMVMSNGDWKHAIKFTKDAFRLAKKNDDLAGEYLDRRFMSRC